MHPERTVVCIAGDGDFLMSGQELATAVQHELPVVVLVVDNGMYGTIRMHQEREFPGRVSGTDLVNPDFAAYARAFGAHGETVERTEDFAAAFERALGVARPALLHLRVDPDQITPRARLRRRRGESRMRRGVTKCGVARPHVGSAGPPGTRCGRLRLQASDSTGHAVDDSPASTPGCYGARSSDGAVFEPVDRLPSGGARALRDDAVITWLDEPLQTTADGPLAGRTLLVKDLIDTAGIRTTYGSRIYADHVPERTAPTVQRLLDAGAVSSARRICRSSRGT